MYDISKLKEEVSPSAVAAYLGIRTVRSGRNIFIECPEHMERTGKPDRNVSNCVLGKTWDKAYYCFACGAHGNVISLIAHVQGLDQKKDFRKICEIAAQCTGTPDMFFTPDQEKKYTQIKTKSSKYPVLTDEELSLIGLSKNVSVPNLKAVYSQEELGSDTELFERHPVISKFKIKTEYLEKTYLTSSVSGLAAEDPELYRELIVRACERTMEKIKELAEGKIEDMNKKCRLGLTQADICLITDIYNQRLIQIGSVYDRFL